MKRRKNALYDVNICPVFSLCGHNVENIDQLACFGGDKTEMSVPHGRDLPKFRWKLDDYHFQKCTQGLIHKFICTVVVFAGFPYLSSISGKKVIFLEKKLKKKLKKNWKKRTQFFKSENHGLKAHRFWQMRTLTSWQSWLSNFFEMQRNREMPKMDSEF